MALFSTKRIYLDYASAPPVCDAAKKAMQKGDEYIGNPGGIHREAVLAKKALEFARAKIAKHFGVKAREIVFTAGLTDANNLAILGTAAALEKVRRTLEGTHWVVSSIEHTSVLDCFSEIERRGGSVTLVDPSERGIIESESVKAALKPESVLVSVSWANNEIGTIQPLSDIARVIRAHEKAQRSTVIFHADAGQAPLYEPSVIESLGVDLLSLGANKLYGPHGIGALYLSNRAQVSRVQQGGPQERGLRPGTESVSLALGFAAALDHVTPLRKEDGKRVRVLRNALKDLILAAMPETIVNGDLKRSLPHMLNISIPEMQSEYVTLALDHAGIAISTKSACREGEERRSHVVEALGGPSWRAENTLRFSLGGSISPADMKKVAESLTGIINKQRRATSSKRQ